MSKQLSKTLRANETPRQRLDTAARAIFDENNPDARSLFAYVQRLLRQYRLICVYEFKDILVEVYARGVKKVEAGEEIKIPLAWFRRTAFHVISEFRRESDKVGYYDLDAISSEDENVLSSIMAANDRKAIRIAAKRLTPKERRLLHLRVVEGLSWRDVGKALVAVGDVEPSELAEQTERMLRQRGYRVLDKLRKLYEEVREEIRLDLDSNEERD